MQDRVLLIAPVFFGYYKEMIKELEQMGYQADYICDTPSNSNISKAIGRINKRLIEGHTRKYFERQVIPRIQGQGYKVVLVIGGMTFSFTPAMVEQLRALNPGAKFILYQWDSEENLPYSKGIQPYFDSIFSFDRFDCQSKARYQFLPLFYTRTYECIGSAAVSDYQYDCSYVGTAHPKKYKCINEMVDALKDILPRRFIYHYMPSKLKYWYHKALSPEYAGAKQSDFQWQKLSPVEMERVIGQSRIILDAPQAGQTGLTIRTIECLGARRKLITVNEDIVNYDFYREENILVFNGSVDPGSRFFTSDYVDLPPALYEKYSLRSWLKTMIC